MPTDDGRDFPIEVRAFDPARHDRAGFDCGVRRLNNFILRSARKQQKGDIVRVYVALRPGGDRVQGYHTINAHALSADDLGPLKPKVTPPHNSLPAIYLSMIAIDRREQGRGLGSILLAHARQKALAVADAVGAWAMVPDVLDVPDDDGAEAAALRAAWYASHGFRSFPSDRTKMFLPVATFRAANAGAEVQDGLETHAAA